MRRGFLFGGNDKQSGLRYRGEQVNRNRIVGEHDLHQPGALATDARSASRGLKFSVALSSFQHLRMQQVHLRMLEVLAASGTGASAYRTPS